MEPREGSEELEILKVDTKGRVRVSRQRREALLEEYGRSSMSAAAFAEWIGVKYPTFCWWLQERKRAVEKAEATKPGGMSWVEATVDHGPGKEAAGGGRLLIELGRGGAARLEVADLGGAALAAEVLRRLGGNGRC